MSRQVNLNTYGHGQGEPEDHPCSSLVFSSASWGSLCDVSPCVGVRA